MRLAARWEQELENDSFGVSRWDASPIELGVGGPEVVRMGSGEPIVLIPGLAGGWRLVAPLARQLVRSGFEVILSGFHGEGCHAGLSRRIDRISDLASDLDHIIAGLHLERPLVMGVSFGGAVALEWAVENPGKLSGLVLHGVEDQFRPSVGSKIARRILERYSLPHDNGFLNQFFNILHGGKPQPGPLVDFVVERCWDTDQGVLAQRLRALETFNVADRLDRLDVPTLVMAGTRDVIVPPARQKALADGIVDGRFVTLEGAGHIGFLTHGEAMVRHVARFRRRLQRVAS